MRSVLRRSQHFRFGAGWALPVVLGGAAVVLGAAMLHDAELFPVRRISVTASFEHLDLAAVRERVRHHARAGFFGIDLDAVARDVKALDWVRRVSVRRVWPDRIRLSVHEQQPVARWNDAGLINAAGEVFTTAEKGHAELVRLDGPDGQAERVLRAYARCRDRIQESGLRLEHLGVDQRGSWRAELGEGVVLRLGQGDPAAVLAKFLSTGLPVLRDRLDRLAYVDLRYTNGFAVAERGDVPGTGEG